MSSVVTVTDLFCGAGGSSLGAAQSGAEIRMALNHWELAVQTHNSNFPNTDHHCCDVSQADPRYYPRTTVLIASPECTNHSLAKGRGRALYKQDLFSRPLIDPSEERSRATMWDVPRFAEVHRYELIIVENVIDARAWVLWDAWLHAMQALGYDWQCVYLNSMICWPTPQSRDRLYVVFWRRGNRAPDLEIRPPCHCERCGDVAGVQTWKRPTRQWGRYGPRGQYVYRCPACSATVQPYYYPALTAIDWTLPIRRIGDRPKPLGEKTLARIKLGLERFAGQRLLVDLLYSHGHDKRSYPTTGPWPTQTGQQSLALVSPFLAALRTNSTPQHFLIEPGIVELRNHGTVRPATDPLATIAAEGNHHGLLVPMTRDDRPRGTGEPFPTQTATETLGLALPFLTRHYTPRGTGAGLSRPVTEPLGTVTGADHHSLIVPFLASYYRTGGLTPASEPAPTVTGLDKHALVAAPFIVSQYNGEHRNPVRSVGEPMPTVPGMAVHHVATPGETPTVEDCGFRMLEPHEIGAAMAFPADYQVLGTKRERVKQYGNAVTPPVMRLLLERCLATLGGAA